VVALRGGMGKKQREAAVATLAAIPPNEGARDPRDREVHRRRF
jgi:hypothetical protein